VESDIKSAKDILCGLMEVARIDVLILLMSTEERQGESGHRSSQNNYVVFLILGGIELDSLIDRLEKETSIDPEETLRVKKKFKQSFDVSQ